ncbi:MAG: ATP-binding protein [Lachnospiraceae bacterium]|nr:ATP-binding protein [Lachnospiraceae bacterium]
MLKRFELRNYKNFKEDIVIDLGRIGGYQFSSDCITDGKIGKMLIYGKNATGKTNLGNALMDIKSNLYGMGSRISEDEIFLNADSDEKCAQFKYVFCFDKDELEYEYSKSADKKLVNEILYVNGKKIFRIDFLKGEYDFDNLIDIDADMVVTDRYQEAMEIDDDAENIADYRISFLRWIISNSALKKDSVLIRLAEYVRRMTMLTARSQGQLILFRRITEMFKDEKVLSQLEEFLNIMGVDCKLVLKELPDGQSELYFAHDKLVPFFRNASSGTMALFDLFSRFIIAGRTSSLLYFDEFDAFYHYEMAENIIKYFKKMYPGCQIIMTTHNTNLMTNKLMRPDCVFILSSWGALTALCDATNRELREGHNLEKMYISGEFERYE